MALTNEPKVGTISGRLEQNQYGYEPRSRVYAGRNLGWLTETSYQKTIKHRRGAAFYDSLEERLSPIRDFVAGAVKPLAPVLNGINGVLENSHAGPLLEQINGATEYVEDLAVQNGFDRRVGTSGAMLVEEVVTAGLGKGVSSVAKGISKLPPPKPMLAVAGGGVSVNSPPIQLPSKGGPVMNIASNMKPANWTQAVKTLGSDKKAIRKLLDKPYHKSMKGSRFEHITMDDLVNDKGGWLTTLMERDSKFTANHADYMKSKSTVKQRKMYDQYTDNPLSDSRQVYDDRPLRNAITKAFNQATGREWHHVFGNKEAGELMLTKIAQDPYIAVNLFHHLKKIKLPVSGKADNIALMKKVDHRKKGGLHSFQKELGIENTGRKKGVLELNDMAAAISDAVLQDKTDVTELFTLIEKYSQLNQQHLRPKIKNEFGGKMLNELQGMEAFIQGQ